MAARLFNLLLCALLAGPLSLSAWAVARPENRVGRSPVFSSDFASQETAKPFGTRAENPGCGYDFASGVHKYLYGEDDPVDGIDPTALQDTTTEVTAEALDEEVDSDMDVADEAARESALKKVANVVAVAAMIAIETLPLGEVTPPPATTPKSSDDGGNDLIFRSMMAAGGLPQVGNTARTLGVRPGELPIGPGNMVSPGTGGMSVALQTPMNLPAFRRPLMLFGTGSDPVWGTLSGLLGTELQLRPDSPTHGLIEPARVMSLSEYQQALGSTRDVWIEVVPGN